MNAMALILLTTTLAAQPAPSEAVESGRQALDRWWSYPWYDADADGIRRINVRDPWMADWDWPNWNLNWNWGLSGWGTALEWFFWLLIVLVLAVVVYLLVRTFVRSDLSRAAGAASKEDEAAGDRQRIESLPFPIETARGDLLAEARRHRERGNYGEAVKFLFSHELVQLDRCRLIRLTRGKTNRQYLREVGPQRTLCEVVSRTMIVFENYFFGAYTISRDQFELCWSDLPRFDAQLAGRTG